MTEVTMGLDTRPADGQAPAAAASTVAVARLRATARAVRAALRPSDLASIAVLTASTLHLVARDGGRNPREALVAVVVVTVGTLGLLPSLRRLPRAVVLLLAALALAPVATAATAPIRAGMARPLVAWALVPGVTLATLHLWHRPWGRRVVGAILLLAAVRSWYGAFLAWWGHAGGRPTWLALSWHNQSGTLMAALGVAAAAVAARLRGGGRAGLGLLAGACLAGAWLSGSRGAIVATIAGLAVAIVGTWIARRSWRPLGVAVGITVCAAVLAVAGLEALAGSEAGQPLTSRDQEAGHNLVARFGHWQGALGMAASRPLLGWGPGSYTWASRASYPPDTNLTASAHNEYVEVLGESGALGAAPVWLAALAIGWLALRVLRRGGSASGVAAASAAAVLGLHAAIDFDWDYPVLLVLLTVAGAILAAETLGTPRATSPADGRRIRQPSLERATAAIAAVAIVVGCAAGVTAATILPSQAPWNLDGALRTAVSAARDGDVADARSSIARAERWNPGSLSLPVVTAVVQHTAGELSDAELADVVPAEHPVSSDHLLVTEQLLRSGAFGDAGAVLDQLEPLLEERRRWGVRQPASYAAAMRLAISAETGGCSAAAAVATERVAWATELGATPDDVAAVLTSEGWGEAAAACDLSGLLGG